MKLLYINETTFKLRNNIYYQWRYKDEIIIIGAEKELKKTNKYDNNCRCRKNYTL